MRLRTLQALAAAGAPTTLLTLTINPTRYNDPAVAAQDLVRCWRLMRQRITRDRKLQKQPFLAVFETTKRGWPHLHILCRLPFIPQAYLSKLAGKYIGSPIVDIRRVWKQRTAAKYIAKYVSKEARSFAGCKRYWRSQDYAPTFDDHAPVADRGRRWFRERASYDVIASNLASCDWHHRPEADGALLLIPGKCARWLWYEHDPPDCIKGRKNLHAKINASATSHSQRDTSTSL